MLEKRPLYLQAVIKILRTGHWLTDMVNQALKPYGISEPQFNVLRILRGQKGKPITVQYIQQHMIQRSSNVTRIVDKLKDKGLVNRAICQKNRRKMDITITKKGLGQLKILDKAVYEMHQPLLNKLTEDESALLIHFLEKIKE